jgi:hypothetical protein
MIYMTICRKERTILSGTKLDARSAPVGDAPGKARIKERKDESGFILMSLSLRPSRLCGENY